MKKHPYVVILSPTKVPIPEEVIDEMERELPECVDCLPIVAIYDSPGPLGCEVFHNGDLLLSFSGQEIENVD